MKKIVILKTGATFVDVAERRGDFEAWIQRGLACPDRPCQVIHVAEGEALPEPETCAAVIVTGSSAMVSHREAWSEASAAWLVRAVAADRFILGICYGHQLLAHGLGGRVGPNPRGREIGTIRVRHSARDDALFGRLPGELIVQATHLESVLELPPGAVHLARNDADPNHAFRVGDRVWGVQFHPEFDADIMRSYIGERRELIADEGGNPEALLAGCRDSPHGRALLARFGELIRESEGSPVAG
jgi:GMP synthase (glutamine-hydrolysing)